MFGGDAEATGIMIGEKAWLVRRQTA